MQKPVVYTGKYWRQAMPGNQKGNLHYKEQEYILQRTGWKVSSRCRKTGKRGQCWHGRMLSGVCLKDENLPNWRMARRLASFILILQQKTNCYPVRGAAHVPVNMFIAFRPPVKPEPYDPRNHLPSQIQAGCHRNVPANIDLYTMGFDAQGVRCSNIRTPATKQQTSPYFQSSYP